MKLLVVAAHPDDEVLGCGGTISRFSQEGHDVYVAILGEGITSRYEQREQADHLLVEALHARSRKVAELLGVKDLFLYSLPDNRFDTIPLLDVVKIIEKLLGDLRPEVIFTHHGGDLNIDHVVVHRAVLTAARPMVDNSVKGIRSFEVPSSTDWAFGQFKSSFLPNVFVDISSTLETKLKAMEIYESEARPFPHPRSVEALETTAKRWGSMVGCMASEAFELIRLVQ